MGVSDLFHIRASPGSRTFRVLLPLSISLSLSLFLPPPPPPLPLSLSPSLSLTLPTSFTLSLSLQDLAPFECCSGLPQGLGLAISVGSGWRMPLGSRVSDPVQCQGVFKQGPFAYKNGRFASSFLLLGIVLLEASKRQICLSKVPLRNPI